MQKRKINLIEYNKGAFVGLPFCLPFCRSNNPRVKKVIYNLPYGSKSKLWALSRDYIIFERNKITFCHEPLDNKSHKGNCLIKISYNPLNRFGNYFDDDCADYKYNDFDMICDIAEEIEKNHKQDMIILDAVAAYISIHDSEKNIRYVKALDENETKELDHFVKKYVPDIYKLISCDEE